MMSQGPLHTRQPGAHRRAPSKHCIALLPSRAQYDMRRRTGQLYTREGQAPGGKTPTDSDQALCTNSTQRLRWNWNEVCRRSRLKSAEHLSLRPMRLVPRPSPNHQDRPRSSKIRKDAYSRQKAIVCDQ